MKQNKTVLWVLGGGVFCNLLLFFVKLYVGLSANSICIWSDAVNNLADTLSCLLSLSFLALALRLGRQMLPRVYARAQQLVSFVLAVIVALVGASFAYSSFERLLYPTPVWFSVKFSVMVLATALAKLGMFFFFRRFARSTGSPVLRVLQHDSLLDFCITLTTLLSFVLTQYASFAVDAIFGLVISGAILINAVKLIREHARSLLDIVDAADRKKVETLISSCKAIEKLEEICYDMDEHGAVTATAQAAFLPALTREETAREAEALGQQCLEQTGIKLRFLL